MVYGAVLALVVGGFGLTDGATTAACLENCVPSREEGGGVEEEGLLGWGFKLGRRVWGSGDRDVRLCTSLISRVQASKRPPNLLFEIGLAPSHPQSPERHYPHKHLLTTTTTATLINMFYPSSAALLFAASTLAAVLPIKNQTTLHPRSQTTNLPPCGVSMFIGGYQPLHHTTKSGDMFINDATWKVTTHTKPAGHGESAGLFPCTKDCGAYPPPFGQETSVFKDPPAVRTFSIDWRTLDPKLDPCNTNEIGDNCDPVLAFPDGWTAHMRDHPACTGGVKRPLLGTFGQWWRCQVECRHP
ncbi:MAG: hypothetical protein M1835_006438 [Candelina submexicana]|nr:MAG: hypothetical protein M1835_006438 [Candelina submexicana]